MCECFKGYVSHSSYFSTHNIAKYNFIKYLNIILFMEISLD